MKKSYYPVIGMAIYFLFLIQMAGTLVESIYILDLMNTALDEKALGLLFFFAPFLLILYRGKHPEFTAWFIFGILVLTRGLTPYLETLGRMLSSGIGTGAALSLFPLLMTARTTSQPDRLSSRQISAGLALGISISVFIRSIGSGLDISLLPEGGWGGWLLGIILGIALTQFKWQVINPDRSVSRSPTRAVVGIFLIIGLAWFAFSAPAVIARWTEGDYQLIIGAVSLFSMAWVGVAMTKPGWIEKISRTWLLIWNLLFTLSLTLTFLAHRVAFPETPDSSPVLVSAPTVIQQLPLILSLALFPVMYLDLYMLTNQIRKAQPEVRDLISGTLLGSLCLVLLVFMQIFSNVWGYVEPISPWFRNKFWLPYLLLTGLLTLIVGSIRSTASEKSSVFKIPFFPTPAVILAFIWLGTMGSAVAYTQTETFPPPAGSLKVMTYNIQQANDLDGERSYQDQLLLIQQVNPDVLALQESDSSRVSLNNNDYVRYYAGNLGYHSYYGPKTTTGTYGTAILSKYPLHNTRTLFSFSDQDEIGSSAAEVMVEGNLFTIFNVHPDGSDTAMLTFSRSLLNQANNKSRVILLGDYNLRNYEEAYQVIAAQYTNAWESVYPSDITPDGLDMSGENRIDHIFISDPLIARDPVYLLPPESATDHPAHWAEIIWDK